MKAAAEKRDTDSLCTNCPGRSLDAGSFIVDSEAERGAYDGTRPYRANRDGTPLCIHPGRIGYVATSLAQTAETPAAEPLQPDRELGSSVADHLRTVHPNSLEAELEKLEDDLSARHPDTDSTEVMRQAFRLLTQSL